VQIDLAEGWKTYWRMPGEAGIAPHFDWSGSHNAADVELRWPAPGRYHDASGETIGYAGRVVFPVTVRPRDPSQPVELALQLSYAVCKDICIPARVDLSQVLNVATWPCRRRRRAHSPVRGLVPQRETPGWRSSGPALEEKPGRPAWR
jgi:DsbC/DsbD-like thiol-disulfide interchange protein